MRPDVVLVSPYPAPGRTHAGTSGVASYTANLARALSDQGASVAVVAPDEAGVASRHSDHGLTVLRSRSRGITSLPSAIRVAARMRPHVIHLQHELFLFGGLWSMAGLPLALKQMRSYEGVAITTVHQVVAPGDITPDLIRLHRLRGPAAAARVGMTAYQRLVSSSGATIVHEEPFVSHIPNGVVIPHGVEKRATLDQARARQILAMEGEQRLVVLCFGFVAPYKGLETALAAAGDVPEVQLVVAGGDHPRHGSSYAEALRNRWGDVARFTGWLSEDEVAAWHSAADLALFCYPAPHSSSGAVAVALGHGMPLLAGEALSECLGFPRKLAVSLERDLLADRLRHLARNRDSLAPLRETSAGIAAGRLWPEVAKRHLRLYEELAAETSDAPSSRNGDVIAEGEGQLEFV